MKKLFKKSIAWIIAVMMVLSTMPFATITASAATYTSTDKTYVVAHINDSKTVTNKTAYDATSTYMNNIVNVGSWADQTATTVNFNSGNSSNRIDLEADAPTNIVGVYTGSGSDIRFPVIFTSGNYGDQTGVSNYMGIDHVAFSTTDFKLGAATWTRCNAWNSLADNSDTSHDFSSSSSGGVSRTESSSGSRYSTKDGKQWKNYITYCGTMNSTDTYKSLKSESFNVQADYSWSWWSFFKTYWGNNSNYTSTVSSSFNLFVLNYEPVLNAIADAKTSAIYNNDSAYTYSSLAKYYAAVKALLEFDINNQTLTSESEVSSVGTTIQNLASTYATAKANLKTTATVKFVNAAGTTVKSETLNVGVTPSVPDATATKTVSNENGTHTVTTYAYPAVSAVTDDVTYTEVATPVTSDCTLDYTTTSEATCISTGSAEATCPVCNYYSTKEIAIDPDSHTGTLSGWTSVDNTNHNKTWSCCGAVGETGTHTVAYDSITATTHRRYCSDGCGWQVINESHSYDTLVSAQVDATCTTAGKTAVYACACGAQTGGEEIPKTGHDYQEVVTAPTCTAQGYTTYTCTRCKDTYVSDYTDALGHDYSVEVAGTAVASTCKTAGKAANMKCSRCDAVQTGAALPLDPENHEGTAEWTKTQTTHKQVWSCCDAVEVEETAHTFENGVCSVCGYGCVHEGGTANCVDKAVCTNCGEAYGEVDSTNHKSVVKDEAVAATCTDTGLTEGSHCEACGEKIVAQVVTPSLGHSFTNYTLSKEATCTANAEETAKCDRCDVTDTREIAGSALGHDYKTEVTAPTCTEQGYTTYTCTRCKNTYVSDYTDALGHDYSVEVADTAVASTCKTAGKAADMKCSRCDAVQTGAALPLDPENHEGTAEWTQTQTTHKQVWSCCDAVEVEETAHTFENGVCSVCGYGCVHEGGTANCVDKAVCTNCGEAYGEVDPANHKSVVTDKAVAATCTDTGLTEGSHCEACGEKIVAQEETPALGHSFTNYVSDGNATCTQDGTKTAKCDRCDVTDTVTDTDSALGHDYKTEVTAPTCTEQGYTTYTCTRCKNTYVSDYTDALGHDYSVEVADTAVASTCKTAGKAADMKCSRCDAVQTGAALPLDPENHEGTAEWTKTQTTHKQVWSCCDAVEVEETAHTFVDGVCSVCGYVCVHEGGTANCVDKAVCTNCGEAYGEVDPTNHKSEVTDPAVAATCTATGLTEGSHCEACNTTIVAQEKTPALGHKYTNYVYNNDATVDADGTETAVCDNGCGTEDTRTKAGTKLPTIAKIGDKAYASVQEAFDAAKAGDTVTLVANTTESVANTNANDFTFDLGEYTLTSASDYTVKNNGGKLTITATTGGIVNTNEDEECGIAVWARTGSVDIQGGNYTSQSTYEATLYVGTSAVLDSGVKMTVANAKVVNTATSYHWSTKIAQGICLNVQNKFPVDSIQVTSGSFSRDPALGDDNLGGTFIAPGYVVEANGDYYDVVPADTSSYDEAVVEAESIKAATATYTAASLAKYTEAVEAAKIDTSAAKYQSEIDDAVTAILSAQDLLRKTSVTVTFYINDEKQESISASYGKEVTLDAGCDYVKSWIVTNNGADATLSTKDGVISIVVTDNITVTAKPSEEEAPVASTKVIFHGKNGVVSEVKYVEQDGQKYSIADLSPATPTASFYTFKNWSISSFTANVDTVDVFSTFEANEDAAKCGVHFNDSVSSKYYDSYVHLGSAPAGQMYALSTDGTEEGILTYIDTDSFYVPHVDDIYVIAVAIPSEAKTAVTGAYSVKNSSEFYFVFNCKFYVPEGATVVEYGAIIDNNGKTKTVKAESKSENNEYSIRVNLKTESTVTSLKGASYVTYILNGETVTVTSDYVTESLD